MPRPYVIYKLPDTPNAVSSPCGHQYIYPTYLNIIAVKVNTIHPTIKAVYTIICPFNISFLVFLSFWAVSTSNWAAVKLLGGLT